MKKWALFYIVILSNINNILITNDKIYNKDKQETKLIYTTTVHVTIFLIVMAMLWIIYTFIFKKETPEGEENTFFQAILFLNSIWALVIVAHYLIVYKWNKSLIEKEIKNIEKENENLKKKLISIQKEQEKVNASNSDKV